MKEIEFLNIDLDIESNQDLSEIVAGFGDRVVVQRNERVGGVNHASFSTGYSEENEIIQEYCALVNGLKPVAREVWDNCAKRVFDIGYESGETPNNFHSEIKAGSIEALAKIGGSVIVTIYPLAKDN